jgi:hypothetical protein
MRFKLQVPKVDETLTVGIAVGLNWYYHICIYYYMFNVTPSKMFKIACGIFIVHYMYPIHS